MSTNSSITILTQGPIADEYKSVYCHYDGYLSYNGAILNEHYNTAEKVEELISHGDMSILGEKIDPDPSREHSFDKRQDDVCVFYHRDRGEKWESVKPLEVFSEKECYIKNEQEYNYLFKDGKWYWRQWCEGEWKDLSRTLEMTEVTE